jgi:uncharacterized protein
MAIKQEDIQASVEETLKNVFELQLSDSKVDKIKTLRGELPLEVKDLEDELAGLETRMSKISAEIKLKEHDIAGKQIEIKDAEAHIKKYTEQQDLVRNNREFESIAKEIEFQKLEIELCNKRIKEYQYDIKQKQNLIDDCQKKFDDRTIDLNHKNIELNDIIQENQKEEEELMKRSAALELKLDARLLSAYKKIRSNARNGLAVCTVARDACGGCFNKIPPQRQLDIKTHKKIIVCEYCGRILVDAEMLGIEVANILPPAERPTIKAPTINRSETASVIDLDE